MKNNRDGYCFPNTLGDPSHIHELWGHPDNANPNLETLFSTPSIASREEVTIACATGCLNYD